jgi:hypothetical protein
MGWVEEEEGCVERAPRHSAPRLHPARLAAVPPSAQEPCGPRSAREPGAGTGPAVPREDLVLSKPVVRLLGRQVSA